MLVNKGFGLEGFLNRRSFSASFPAEISRAQQISDGGIVCGKKMANPLFIFKETKQGVWKDQSLTIREMVLDE